MKNAITCIIAAIVIVSYLYSQDVEKDRQVQNFKDKYPGELSIQWDKNSGGPQRIIGNNIYLKSRFVNKTNIQRLAKNFIEENSDLFNIVNTELHLERITELKDKFVVAYQQMYQNIPLWNVKLRLKVTGNGQVLMIKSPCFNNPGISIQPTVTADETKKIVAANFNISESKIQEGELIIYPQRETGKLYLCWHMKIGNGVNKGVMIDAQTGKKIFGYDLFRNAEIKGTVQTTTWSLPGQTGGSPNANLYCQDLKVNVYGMGSNNTNPSGHYSISVPSAGNYPVISSLDGPHCWVANFDGSNASHSGMASTSSDYDWIWQESVHYNEYFVFYYMNNAWNEFNDQVSGFSSNYWYTNKMEGWANEDFAPGRVSGYADGSCISITPLNHYGGSVYHEYSHNVNYRTNGYWLGDTPYLDGYAMDEGLADYFSCSFTNDPNIYPLRTLNGKTKYYPPGPPNDDYHDGHTRGVIIGGACWDLAQKSGMSFNYVNALVYEAIANMGYEETFGCFMDEILSADDNDGNIFNGTPHSEQIFDAFVNDHAIIGSYLVGTTKTNISIMDINNVILLGNVYVNDGRLTIESGGSVNLNGHSVFSTGGHITVEGGSTVTGLTAEIIGSGEILGVFSSIQTALTTAADGRTVFLTSNNTTISSSVTVPSGATLELIPSQSIAFGNGSSLMVNGTLNAVGTSAQPIAFTRSGASGNWGSIQFSGNGASGSTLSYCNIQYGTEVDVVNGANNVTIDHCYIANSSSHGINVSSSSNFTASYNTIANGNVYHGITISGGSNHYCFKNTIYKYSGTPGYNNGVGILFGSSAAGAVLENDVDYNNWGIGSIYGSSINASTSHSDVNNRIAYNLIGLHVYSSGWANFGTGYDINARNSIYGNTYNVQVGNTYMDRSTLYGSYNWWGAAPPQTAKFSVWPLCTFTYNDWYISDPWTGPPLPLIKSSGQMAVGVVNANIKSTSQIGSLADQIQEAAADEELQDSLLIGKKFNGKNNEAVEYLKSYINNHPDNPAGYVVLNSFADNVTTPEIIDFLKSSNAKAPAIHKLLLANVYQMDGKPDLAEKANNDLIAENPNTSLAVAAAISNMRIELYTNNNVEAAQAILKEVEKQKDLIDPMELADARQLLVTYVDPKTGMMPNIGQQNGGETISQTINTVSLDNYPNPFNPATTISYALPKDGIVTIKIFDMLGREVKTLVNEFKTTGRYTAAFDASKLASGIYIYRLISQPTNGNAKDGFTAVKKMMLVK